MGITVQLEETLFRELCNQKESEEWLLPEGEKTYCLKKPLSGYFLFLQDERPKAKEELQSLNLPNNMVDVSKEVARRWAEARETTKAEYERRYRVAKIEYDKAMESIPISQRQS